MLDLTFDPGNPLFYLFLFFAATFVVLAGFYWIFFFRMARSRRNIEKPATPPVSVVICARNEYHHLQENLSLILAQDYPNFEVVVVNNSSDDDSSFLLERMATEHPNLSIVEIRENLNFFSGKKFPLSIGIKSAKHEWLLLTDADCRPAGNQWIRTMMAGADAPTEVVLGYGAYNKAKGLLNRLIRYDTARIAMQYLSFALAGIPYMGVGRNMAYRKSLFYRNNGFISHYKLNSGDDDLFVNRVATSKNTRVAIDPEGFTLSEPKIAFRHWMIQKRRHLQTGGHYKFVHKILLGLYGASQLFFYLALVILLSFEYNILLVLGLFVVKTACQYIVSGLCFSRLKEKDLIALIPLFEILVLLINGWVSFRNLFARPVRWK
jgi:glycosyltransferase involved in cell wall biosynthesis